MPQTKDSKQFVKDIRALIKVSIEDEEKLREEMKKDITKLFDELSILLEGGVNEADLTDETTDKIMEYKSLERIIQSSTYDEKFYRYTYNLDIVKMKKYHDKINEKDLEELEDISDIHQRGGNVQLKQVDIDEDREDSVILRNSEAHLQFSRDIKQKHDNREKLIKTVLRLKENGF